MKVSARMKFIGRETGTTRNGKTYFLVGLLQGMESERIYVNEEIYGSVAEYKPFMDVDCDLNIQIGSERTFVNLENIQPVEVVKK